jgi:hypothetical protein
MMVRTFSLLFGAALFLNCAGQQAATKPTEAPGGGAQAVAQTTQAQPAPSPGQVQPGQAQPAQASSESIGRVAKLTVPEREVAMKELIETRQKFLASMKGLSEAQFRWKPAPDRWSVAEIAEHLALAEERLFGMITEKIMKSPTPPELLAQVQRDDEKLRKNVLDRSNKVKAPEMLQPAGKYNSVDAVTTAFNDNRDKTVAYVRNTQEDLRGHAAPHPLLKALDGYQWILLLSAHSARHTAQIEEVKADPRFPRK